MIFDYQPTLNGDLLLLRPLNQSDFDALYEVASDPQIWKQHPAINRYRKAEFRTFFDESINSKGTLVAIKKESKSIIGSSRYHGYDKTSSEIEIGWSFLAKQYWGGTYNGEMKKLMLNHAFKYVNSVILLVGPDNIRSQRAIEKIGGKRDGVRKDASGLVSYLYRIYSHKDNKSKK